MIRLLHTTPDPEIIGNNQLHPHPRSKFARSFILGWPYGSKTSALRLRRLPEGVKVEVGGVQAGDICFRLAYIIGNMSDK